MTVGAPLSGIPVRLDNAVPVERGDMLELKYETKQTIGDMIRYFKGRCSFKTKINWQRNYYEHIIRNEKEYYAICDYIINNH